MAYGPTRSMNSELSEGMTDGKYKKVRPDISNRVFDETYTEQRDLHDVWYGLHEKDVMVAPDALMHPHPDYVATPPVNRLQD